MVGKLARYIVIGALLSVPLSTSAHHGTGISYDLTVDPVTAKGTVTEFRWWNPHASIFFDIKNDKGAVEHWAIEGNSPYNWARLGFKSANVEVWRRDHHRLLQVEGEGREGWRYREGDPTRWKRSPTIPARCTYNR
jgi:hypothetical protein